MAAVHTRYSQGLTGLSEALPQQTADLLPAQGSSLYTWSHTSHHLGSLGSPIVGRTAHSLTLS